MRVKLLIWMFFSLGLSGCATTQSLDPFSGEYLGNQARAPIANGSSENLIFNRLNETQWQMTCTAAEVCQGLGKTWTVVPSESLIKIFDKKVDVSKIICISDNIKYPSPMLCKVPKDQILRFSTTGSIDFPIPSGYAVVGGTPAGVLAWAVLKVK